MELSLEIQEYFSILDKDIQKSYELAGRARAFGLDPEKKVDIPIAEDMAARVEGLVGMMVPSLVNSGLKEEIRVLEKNYGKNDERVALKSAELVAKGKFCKFDSVEQALEVAVRVGIAYTTLAVVTAPLEGVSHVKIKENYVSIYYAGPIRAAGGTAEALSVLITDYIRKQLGVGAYKPTEEEINRYATEIEDYHRLVNLQYLPTKNEIVKIIKNLPVCLDGTPTERAEVSNYKDLPRVETNRVRGGMCLVLAEGVASKAVKLTRIINKLKKEFDMGSWDWITEYIKLQKKEHTVSKEEVDSGALYSPNTKYIERVIAGRPVLSDPAEPGGFRLRYGKSRTAGLAATSVHPITMYLTGFMAIGTQIATELPGKATVCTPVSTVEPPVVKLKNGSVILLETKGLLDQHKSEISEILSLGDILIPYGEFVSQGHILLPGGYCEEWWALEVKEALKKKHPATDVSAYIKKPYLALPLDMAFKISRELGVPLHPRYNYFWHDITKEELVELAEWVSGGVTENSMLILNNAHPKAVLEKICMPHEVDGSRVTVNLAAEPLYALLGAPTQGNLDSIRSLVLGSSSVMDALTKLSGVKIREKGITRVGSKMGRPEKAERRLMKGRPQVLFPCGSQGGRMRNITCAYNLGYIDSVFPLFTCLSCRKTVFFPICPDCGSKAEKQYICTKCSATTKEKIHKGCGGEAVRYKQIKANIKPLLEKAMKNLGIRAVPELFKGVRGTFGRDRLVEPLEKGLLREKYGLYVNKDGTVRYDLTDVPLSHFKPKEIGTSIDKLKELGYTKDINNEPLENEEQILALKPQDIVISDNKEFSGVDYLINISKFVDELLTKVYKLNPFYNIKKREDLMGQLVIGLAPHTSAGIIGRIIGFTPAKVCFAHPFWHAAKRRNADGDEDSVMLLLDALLNFSREFLPDTRGAKTMDAPLVLTTHLDPEEVDNEAWSVDAQDEYPLELYESAMKYEPSWDLKGINLVKNFIGTPEAYRVGFTHDTEDINDGPVKSKYVLLEAMTEKVAAQLALAQRIRAVDENRVASLVLSKHFLKDIKGNLRTYSRQKLRCVSCNAKYRRPPLLGKCVNCGGKLLMTVHEGTIRKYIEPAKQIMEGFKVSSYLRQQFSILEQEVDAAFGKKDRQAVLARFNAS